MKKLHVGLTIFTKIINLLSQDITSIPVFCEEQKKRFKNLIKNTKNM